ncbi:MAG TPA: LON peptidase substrate-binding domain-containing protein [Arenimonas sp.]|nr:LON peptidase substrate-binding domain-containing protein [Arenimonas sp.]
MRRCGRSGETFGICLILEGEEVGDAALPAALGTEAAIIDFDLTEEGLLGITVEGRRRFRVQRSEVRPDGLVVADVDWLPDPEPEALAPEHGLLALLLERILERAEVPDDGEQQQRLQQADWVAWRLGEWLPLDSDERQRMLEAADGHARLELLLQRLPDFQED